MQETTRHDKQKGQALVEFALTLPILLFVILGIIDLARVLFGLTQVIDSARQGVRYGLVQGLDRDTVQWFDCAGIRQQVRDLPGLLQVSDSDIDIFWKDAQGNNKFIACSDSLSSADFAVGDMLAVRVRGSVKPITPVLSSIVNTIPFSYTATRTMVLSGADYTEEWIEPPPAPESFAAIVDCEQDPIDGNVDFYWNPMNPAPDSMEIRSAYTNEAIIKFDGSGMAACEGCATVPDGDYDMYYLVALEGDDPYQIAGPPSNYVTVSCGVIPEDLVLASQIRGYVWHDVNGDGIRNDTVSEPGLPFVTVYLLDGGDNGMLEGYGSDDNFYAVSTDSTGLFYFSGLEIPRGLTAQYFRVEVVEDGFGMGNFVQVGDYRSAGEMPSTNILHETGVWTSGGTEQWNLSFGYFDAQYVAPSP